MNADRSKLAQVLDLLATLAFVVACVSVAWYALKKGSSVTDGGQPAAREPSRARTVSIEPISIATAAIKGNLKAPVAIVGFSDFQCPFCAKFSNSILPELERELLTPGKALFAFRHLPLDTIHSEARLAAFGAECAHQQGQFWLLHDRLFADPKRLSRDFVLSTAKRVVADSEAFERCFASPPDKAIQADVQLAGTLGVAGTPTFLIGRVQGTEVRVSKRLDGARPAAEFISAVNELLR